MSALMWLAPLSVLLGLIGLGAFAWSFAAGQYEDPEGDAARILIDEEDGDSPPSPTQNPVGTDPEYRSGPAAVNTSDMIAAPSARSSDVG